MLSLAVADAWVDEVKQADYRKAMGEKLLRNQDKYKEMIRERLVSSQATKKPFKPVKRRVKFKSRQKVGGYLGSDVYLMVSELLKEGMTPAMRKAMPWMKGGPASKMKPPASGILPKAPKGTAAREMAARKRPFEAPDPSIQSKMRRKKRRKPVA